MSLLQIYQWVCNWKNFENRSTFGEVTEWPQGAWQICLDRRCYRADGHWSVHVAQTGKTWQLAEPRKLGLRLVQLQASGGAPEEEIGSAVATTHVVDPTEKGLQRTPAYHRRRGDDGHRGGRRWESLPPCSRWTWEDGRLSPAVRCSWPLVKISRLERSPLRFAYLWRLSTGVEYS